MTPPLILASASPRRRQLLGRLGLAFDIEESHVDEAVRGPLPVTALVRDLALRMARAVAGTHMTGIVIAADTEVAVDGIVLGKPTDAADAARMLQRLCGRSHTVATGVAVVNIDAGTERAAVAVTRVTMHAYTDEQIAAYVASREPLDKPGAYAIQGGGGALVMAIEGRLDTVAGLPLDLVADLLGVDPPV
ncbi:MAG TPA: Maf family protein [Euzebyales bacterium]|nr:Maf family protein [Euzebyales bacterium]